MITCRWGMLWDKKKSNIAASAGSKDDQIGSITPASSYEDTRASANVTVTLRRAFSRLAASGCA